MIQVFFLMWVSESIDSFALKQNIFTNASVNMEDSGVNHDDTLPLTNILCHADPLTKILYHDDPQTEINSLPRLCTMMTHKLRSTHYQDSVPCFVCVCFCLILYVNCF